MLGKSYEQQNNLSNLMCKILELPNNINTQNIHIPYGMKKYNHTHYLQKFHKKN